MVGSEVQVFAINQCVDAVILFGIFSQLYFLLSMYSDSKQRSRTGYSTPDRKSMDNSYISTGYDEVSNSSPAFFNIFKTLDWLRSEKPKTNTLNIRSFSHQLKREERLRKRKILKEILNKIMVCRYNKHRDAFRKIQCLPQRNIKIDTSKQWRLKQISQMLIFKTPITTETALARSVLNLRNWNKEQNCNRVEIENRSSRKKMKIICHYQAVIYPSEQNNMRRVQKKAIYILEQLAKQKIKSVIRCFKNQHHNKSLIKAYIKKIIQNFKQNQAYFIHKLRVVTKIERESIINTKRKCLQDALNKCIQRRDKLLIENFKLAYQRSVIDRLVFLELVSKRDTNIKLQAFFAIYKYAYRRSLKNPEEQVQQSKQHRKIFRRTNNQQNPHIRNLRKQIESLKKKKN